MTDARDLYLLGYRPEEQARLERQALELAGESERLFDDVGVRPGWQVVEVGCGPRGCLDLLARRVGPSGRVVGVERSAEQALRAQRFAAEQGLANVEVLERDARATGLPDGRFDLATARLVLVNVPRPAEILDEMVRLVRPGGFVALHEPDSTTRRCDPPLEAQTRLIRVLDDYAAAQGMDRSIGLHLPRLLRERGVRDVRVHPLVHIYPPGHGRRRLVLEFAENSRARVVEQGLARDVDIARWMRELDAHLDDPGTLVVSSLFIQAWGAKAPE